MNPATYIPGKTRNDIANPEPTGGRHDQAKRIVVSLIGQGVAPGAVFAQCRAMYAADFTDKEIGDVIQWATRQNFTPCTPRFTGQRIQAKPAATTQFDPSVAIDRYLDGEHKFCPKCDQERLAEKRNKKLAAA